MNTELENAVNASDKEAQYDACAKRLLGVLLSKKLSPDEKLNIVEKEYDIPMERNLRKDVSVMCNLSQGVKEEGIAIGEARGEAGIILKMYKNGLTVEQIAEVTDKAIEEVEAIIEGKDTVII